MEAKQVLLIGFVCARQQSLEPLAAHTCLLSLPGYCSTRFRSDCAFKRLRRSKAARPAPVGRALHRRLRAAEGIDDPGEAAALGASLV